MLSMETLGERIAYLRNKHNLTQRQLMNQLKIDNLSRYERNERRPSIDTIIAIANFFNVSTDWLLLGREFVNDDPNRMKSSAKPEGKIPFFKKESSPNQDHVKIPSTFPINNELNKKGFNLNDYAELVNTLEALPMEQISEILEYAKFKASQYFNKIKEQAKGYKLKKYKGIKNTSFILEKNSQDEPSKTKIFSNNLIPLTHGSPPADFALIIRDNSMVPIIPMGTILFIRKKDTVEHGEIGIFEISGELICRKYRRVRDYILLEPINHLYPSLVLRAQAFHSTNHYQIIDKVYYEPYTL